MNDYLRQLLHRFEAVLHPATGKGEPQKTKRRHSKPSLSPQTSPDSLHIRASVRSQNAVRKCPAP